MGGVADRGRVANKGELFLCLVDYVFHYWIEINEKGGDCWNYCP
jgi:hypothetical protein